MRKSYSSEFKLNAASMVLDQSLPVPEICASLDIGPTALRRWVERVRKERAGSTMAGIKAITAYQKKIQELQALLRQKDRDIENPKKGQCSPAFGLQRSFPLISELGEQYGITDCCRVFEANRSSYYAWRQRQGKTHLAREAFKVVLVKYHKASRGSAGARTLSEDLRGAGHQVWRYMARSLMKEAG